MIQIQNKFYHFLDNMKKQSKQQTNTSTSTQPIWVSFQKILNDVPKEILDKLPSDSASELDHYLYGKPKKKMPLDFADTCF